MGESSEWGRTKRPKAFPLSFYDQYEVDIPRKGFRSPSSGIPPAPTKMPITNPTQQDMSVEDMTAVAWAYEEDSLTPGLAKAGRRLTQLSPSPATSSGTSEHSPVPRATRSCSSTTARLEVITIDDDSDDDLAKADDGRDHAHQPRRPRLPPPQEDLSAKDEIDLFGGSDTGTQGPPSLEVFRARYEDNQAHIQLLTDRRRISEGMVRDQERRERRLNDRKERKDRVKGMAALQSVPSPAGRIPETNSGGAPKTERLSPLPTASVRSKSSIPTRPAPYPLKVKISPMPGKGQGLVAITNIPQGGLIVSEKPFLEVDSPFCSKQISGKVRQLSTADKQLFQSFTVDPAIDTGSTPAERRTGLVARYVIPMGGDSNVDSSDDVIPLDQNGNVEISMRCGIFKYICRANHSCVPNSRWSWNVTTKQLELKAIMAIPLGQEVTACYLQDSTLPFAKRQALLLDSWSFTCACPKCSLPPAERKMSDQRLDEYRMIRKHYIGIEKENNWQVVGFQESWRKLGVAIDLLVKEDILLDVPECWKSRYEASVRWGNGSRANEAGLTWLKESLKIGDPVSQAMALDVKAFNKRKEWRAFEASEPESDTESDDDFTFERSSGGHKGKQRSATSARPGRPQSNPTAQRSQTTARASIRTRSAHPARVVK